MIRWALLALIAALLPAAATACRAPPHLTSDFRKASYTVLPLCAEGLSPECRQARTTSAWFEAPTRRYPHGVLGDDIEAGTLRAHSFDSASDSCSTKSVQLSEAYVFEDIKPRLIDLDGDGRMEIVTVQSHRQKGAQLAIYKDIAGKRELELISATPHIGRANRWLAPIGAADFDSDGHIEIAYIDRPHLAKTLRLWRFKGGKLRDVVALEGLTNHQIGWNFIASGVRDCGQGAPEMITADASWQHIMATRFDGKTITARRIGKYRGPESISRALSCPK